MVKQRISLTLALVVTLSCGAGSALAGSNNTLRVIQNGWGNSLYVDQSNASNSLVLGPSSKLVTETQGIGTYLGNQLDGVSDGDYGPNELSLESVTSQELTDGSTARQNGSDNVATIEITGEGGEIQLLQDSSDHASLSGNVANITAYANTLGAVLQFGGGNTATLDLDEGAKGRIAQNGNGNTGKLFVESGGSGKLIQNGTGNFYTATISPNTTDVTVVQNGRNLSLPTGARVFSTTPGVTVIQTGW